jgi:hypothetical protein
MGNNSDLIIIIIIIIQFVYAPYVAFLTFWPPIYSTI